MVGKSFVEYEASPERTSRKRAELTKFSQMGYVRGIEAQIMARSGSLFGQFRSRRGARSIHGVELAIWLSTAGLMMSKSRFIQYNHQQADDILLCCFIHTLTPQVPVLRFISNIPKHQLYAIQLLHQQSATLISLQSRLSTPEMCQIVSIVAQNNFLHLSDVSLPLDSIRREIAQH